MVALRESLAERATRSDAEVLGAQREDLVADLAESGASVKAVFEAFAGAVHKTRHSQVEIELDRAACPEVSRTLPRTRSAAVAWPRCNANSAPH